MSIDIFKPKYIVQIGTEIIRYNCQHIFFMNQVINKIMLRFVFKLVVWIFWVLLSVI